MDENSFAYNTAESEWHIENDWKELISKERHAKISSDGRSFSVHGALWEKLDRKCRERDKPKVEIQLESSEWHLQELIKFGNEMVNNIKSSYEYHEISRSKEKRDKEIELQENLRKEAELSLSQFDEINKKWKDMKRLKEPMGIHEDMQSQQENIKHLMTSKDELIEQCEQELEKLNKQYYEDLDKQSDGICLLVERVDHQIILLRKFYRSSLNDLENTIERERQKILQSGQEKWNVVYDHLMNNEGKQTEMAKKKQHLYAQELDNIRNKQEEITRTTKIRLEKDAELLEAEIRKVQANILMNSEKIDYNYQVLQKRNDENIIINNHQKRRVAKLNETIVGLKKKLTGVRDDHVLAMEKLTFDIQKLHSGINDLHIKSEHFRQNNSIKLAKIWNINFKEVKHLMARVLEIDRILYEQQLGRQWPLPNIDFDKLNYKEYFEASPKAKPALAKQHKTSCWNPKYLRDILFKISDRAGFLIEDKLSEILAPYTHEEQCFVKIESIFLALNIKNIKEVESLMKYFEPYSWCKNCSLKPNGENNSNTVTSMKSSKIECKNHNLYMEPAFVLCALNDYMDKELKSLDNLSETSKSKTSLDLDLLLVDKTDISSYWQQFTSLMTEEQQNVWKSIEHGLSHYLEVLKKRSQLYTECIFLQKQNAELKHLLQKL